MSVGPLLEQESQSAAEWEARLELAACHRLIEYYEMSDLVYGHASVRVPKEPSRMLIKPYPLFYDEVTASSLCKVEFDGTVIGPPRQVNSSVFVLHAAIYQARPDVFCIVHTHTRAGLAVSAMKCGILPLNQTAMQFYERCGFHDYEGVAEDLSERARIVRDLGALNYLILRNHGLLVVGQTVREAFRRIYSLEQACRAQVDTLACGTEISMPPKELCEKTARYFDEEKAGELEWEGWLRMLDRLDPGFRT